MAKATKNNPHRCPECEYTTTRKWNLKKHIRNVHHLEPFLPGPSQNQWVFAQLKHRAELLARAERDGDKEKERQYWDSMLALWKNHQNIMTEDMLFEYKKRARKELERLSG